MAHIETGRANVDWNKQGGYEAKKRSPEKGEFEPKKRVGCLLLYCV